MISKVPPGLSAVRYRTSSSSRARRRRMRTPPLTTPTTNHTREPAIPRRMPVPVRRRSNAANIVLPSDPFDLEDHLALPALALAEPVRGGNGDDRHPDRDRNRRHLDLFDAFV